MGILKELNIVKADEGQAATIFEDLYPTFLDLEYSNPAEYVRKYWESYLEIRLQRIPNEQKRRGINGKILEYIISTLLIRENIFPIFINAKVAFVPNINYDILLFSKENGPICLSVKTSFRERYKQADLEAMALKNVHRISRCFLITLSDNDANSLSEKILKGDTFGLNDVIVATSNKFNEFIKELKELNLSLSPSVNVIESTQIITKENFHEILIRQ